MIYSVFSNNRAAIDAIIVRKIEDMEMKTNTKDYLKKIKNYTNFIREITNRYLHANKAIGIRKDLIDFFENNCNNNEKNSKNDMAWLLHIDIL